MGHDSRNLVFTGCLNRQTPGFPSARGKGITSFAFDEETGRLSALAETLGIDNPTYLTIHPRRPWLYAVSEVFGWNEGVVSAYRIDADSGALTYINKQPTLGSLTTHCSLDRSGKHLLVANYSHDGMGEVPGKAAAVLPLREDGGLDPAASSIAHRGTGPVAGRQEGPHPHGAWASPDNRFVIVADLGADRIMCHAFDPATGRLTEAAAPGLQMPPGSGPRQVAFHPDGRFLYVINELNSTISAVAYGAESASLEMIESIPALPATFSGANHSACLRISANGQFLYSSHRGHDSIVVHTVEATTGRLRFVGHTSTRGHTPRNFALSPSGRFLLAGNQNSDAVAVFRVATQSGLLEATGPAAEVGTPMCVKFAKFEPTHLR
jgi:6-phosphogluconolactonase